MDRNFQTPSQLNKFPVDWKVKPFWSITKKKSETNNEGLDLLSVYLNQGVVRFDDVNEKRTNVTSEDTSKYQKVERGNLVLNNQQAWRGSVGVSRFEGIVSPAYIVLELSKELETGYSNYLFRDQYMVDNYAMSSKGVGSIQQNIFFPILRTTPVPIPPFQEQKLISRYLDKKTSQIDSLVEKIKTKIELLKEQRTSLINRYVTKGLDPNVEMKDSGIEWIGEIPKDWDVQRISTLYSQTSIRGFSEEQNLSVFRDHGVVRRDDYENKNVLSDDLSNYKLVNKGDLVLNKMKTWMGSLGVSEYRGIVSPAYYVLRPNFEFFSGYLHHLLRSKIYIDQYGSVSKGVRPGQWDLSYDEFKSLKVILPPVDEQKEIYNRLTKELEFNSQLSNLESKKVEFLEEYRQSLISSIVTGQIRVTEDMI